MLPYTLPLIIQVLVFVGSFVCLDTRTHSQPEKWDGCMRALHFGTIYVAKSWDLEVEACLYKRQGIVLIKQHPPTFHMYNFPQ